MRNLKHHISRTALTEWELKMLHGLCTHIMLSIPFALCGQEAELPYESHRDPVFKQLSKSWDEAIPLGNGLVGALVWQNGPNLRISLDRADLWDLRPMDNLDTPEWKFKWVYEQWGKKDSGPVQKKFDVPYDAK